MHLFALVHLLVLVTGRQSDAAEAPAFYSVGYYDCLAVEEQHQLQVGSPRVVLAPGQKPLRVTVDAMVPWKEPSTERRPHGDCTGAYTSDLEDVQGARAKVTQFAHISPLPEDHFDYEVLFAVPHPAPSSSAAHQPNLAHKNAGDLWTASDRLCLATGALTARSFARIDMDPRAVMPSTNCMLACQRSTPPAPDRRSSAS